MLTNESRITLIGGLWLFTAATVAAISISVGARLSTSVLLIAMCAVPMVVALVLGLGAPAPTAAELLYAVNSRKDGRS